MLRTWVEGGRVVLELDGFRFSFEPKMAIAGSLAKPTSLELRGEVVRVGYEGGEGFIHLLRRGSGTVLVAAEAQGHSYDGTLVELRSRLEGCERLLLHHYTYDPPNYFPGKEVVEPYSYPPLREADALEYCPWSYPIHRSALNGLPHHLKVLHLLAKGKKGYALLLPASNEGARGHITSFAGEEFSIVLYRGVADAWSRLLVASFTVSPSPYRAVEEAYEEAFTWLGKAHYLRKRKALPDVFKYLGWCSWNAFWREPTAEKVLATCESLVKSGVKPGFALIDDGWQDEEDTRMRRVEPNPMKFPEGFAHVVKRVREMGIPYVGLWHTLNVHWNGVLPDSELAREWGNLLMEAGGRLVPNPNHSFELFMGWYRKLKEWGFDFVKVDNQSFVGHTYLGKKAIEEAARKLHEGFEAAAHINSLEVLNCMAQEPENIFNWSRSAVARNCVDYVVPHFKSRDGLHLHFNAYNALFMSQVVWPDWDMFQSHDPWALQQAVARALSGGPVYTTDEPGKTVVEVVKPLAFSDGSLPLPDEPALPTEDVLMRDPYNERVPLKVFTRVTVEGVGTYGMVGAFNINKDGVPIEGRVEPRDALLPNGKYLIYEYFSEWLSKGGASFSVESMGVKLFILAPIKSWFTPVGLKEVYIMPRGVEFASIFSDEALLKLREPGTLVAKCDERVKVEGGEVVQEEPLLKVKCWDKVVRVKLT